MKQLKKNPTVAIAGEWFTAHGKGLNSGYFGKKDNRMIAEKLKTVFADWIDNGHNNFDDENTVILCVELSDGLLLHMAQDMYFKVAERIIRTGICFVLSKGEQMYSVVFKEKIMI